MLIILLALLVFLIRKRITVFRVMVTAYVVLAVTMGLSACSYLPSSPAPSSRTRAYVPPPCNVAQPSVPCRRPVTDEPETACDKRFGKNMCGKPHP